MHEPQPSTSTEQSLDVRRPFTRADAMAAAIDPRLLRGKNFRRIFKGVYVSVERSPSALLQVEAALTIHPLGAFASHFSAARVYDVPVPHHADEHISVFAEVDRRRRKGIACHVAPANTRIGLLRGVRVSSPTSMFIELASVLTLVDLVIVGDALVKRKRVTPEDLRTACRDSTDPHAGAASRAADFIREDVDSPMESRLRMLLVLAGLPEPKVNYKVRNEHGDVLRRFDLSYPEYKLLVEYDGRQHAEDVDQYASDIYRREDLDRRGWRLVIITSRGIFQQPQETLNRVRTALKERGATGLPRVFSDEWRAHFPVQQPIRRSS